MLFEGGYTFANFLANALAVFLFIVWFWLLIVVFGDLFRRQDISGWGKAAWVIGFDHRGRICASARQAGSVVRLNQNACPRVTPLPYLAHGRVSSWPRLSRPSTPSYAADKDVDGLNKSGHDGGDVTIWSQISCASVCRSQ
jgi:hypothetical protein